MGHSRTNPDKILRFLSICGTQLNVAIWNCSNVNVNTCHIDSFIN
jgi:hypothetical protein